MSQSLTLREKVCLAVLPGFSKYLKHLSNSYGNMAFYGIAEGIIVTQSMLCAVLALHLGALLFSHFDPYWVVSYCFYLLEAFTLYRLWDAVNMFSDNYGGWTQQYGPFFRRDEPSDLAPRQNQRQR